MEALKPKDYPIEMIWNYTNSIFEEFSILYQKPFHRHLPFLNLLPRVVTFNSNDFRSSFEVYPRRASHRNNNYRKETITEMARLGIPAAYDRLLGFFYDRKYFLTDDDITRTITEETTHHVIQLGDEGRIEVNQEDLRSLNETVGQRGLNYGDRLVAAIDSLEQIKGKPHIDFDLTPRVVMDEFFIPISLAFIFKDAYLNLIKNKFQDPDWNWLYIYFPKGKEDDPKYKEENYRRAYKIMDTVEHLPYFAGHKLVMKYDGNVQALMDDFPYLAHENPRILWEQFSKPLLLKK